jgi:hypothetical protein
VSTLQKIKANLRKRKSASRNGHAD